MAHQYMPKIFHDPHKNPLAPPPTYLMYGPLADVFSCKYAAYFQNISLQEYFRLTPANPLKQLYHTLILVI